MSISAVILTKNEEKKIEKCLKSVSFCDEVIVVDDNSTDETRKIAEDLGALVFIKDLNKDFSSQRNFGLEKAMSDWVLFIDADEIVIGDLAREIKEVTKDNENDGFYLKRKDVFFGKTLNYGETGNIKILRLAKKEADGMWKRVVHETWQVVHGSVGTLKNPLLHYSHPSLRDFIKDIDEYSTLHATANYDEGKKSSLWKIICYPKFKFVNSYILKLGFLDGVNGIIFALFMSFHSFLAWSKLWLLQKNLKAFKY